jgi:hypothetical protein
MADEAQLPDKLNSESPQAVREFFGDAGTGVESGPVREVITNGADYARVWRQLGLDREPGAVDFAKELVVVSTTRGSRITFRLRDEGEGRLQVMSISTRDIRPGLRFGFCVLTKSGWKQINDSKI